MNLALSRWLKLYIQEIISLPKCILFPGACETFFFDLTFHVGPQSECASATGARVHLMDVYSSGANIRVENEASFCSGLLNSCPEISKESEKPVHWYNLGKLSDFAYYWRWPGFCIFRDNANYPGRPFCNLTAVPMIINTLASFGPYYLQIALFLFYTFCQSFHLFQF